MESSKKPRVKRPLGIQPGIKVKKHSNIKITANVQKDLRVEMMEEKRCKEKLSRPKL